ncbi:MAG: hypothetical protein KAX49_00315 [Halanaerobiales bacterium]|nr:hypothetical protein [Halanaerobiales bacterium]
MKKKNLIIWLVILVGMMLGCFGFAIGIFKQVDSYTEKVPAKEKLILKNYKGKVTLEPTQGDELVFIIEKEVRGDIKTKINEILDEVNVIFEEDEDTVMVTIDRPDQLPLGVSETVINFRIQVPESIVRYIDIDTRFARVVVNDLSGELKVRTRNYPILITNFKGNLYAKTNNQSITLENVSGYAEIETKIASIIIKEFAGSIKAKTTNNPIHFSSTKELENVYLETKISNIYYESMIKPDGTYRMKTSNGKIVFSIPENSKINLHAHVSNGSIKCSLPLKETFFNDKENLVGIINGEGAEVDLIGIHCSIYIQKWEE